MAKVIIGLGSNKNNPLQQLREAKLALNQLSNQPLQYSRIYRSEPLGPSTQDFLNGIIELETTLNPDSLFKQLKIQEKKQGRPSRYPKWSARTLDLDIIAWEDLVVETDSLIIPHAEYTKRLFVLYPLREIHPDWKDPVSNVHIGDLVKKAPEIEITTTDLVW